MAEGLEPQNDRPLRPLILIALMILICKLMKSRVSKINYSIAKTEAELCDIPSSNTALKAVPSLTVPTDENDEQRANTSLL